jgi:hypothetical protein
MLRLWMFCFVLLLMFLFGADRAYLRHLTAEKSAVSVSVKQGNVKGLVIETQEVVNEEGIMLFAKKAAAKLMNYRPGRVEEHMDSDEVKDLFISDEYHEFFRDQFVAWSLAEFRVNNVAIKDAFVRSPTLLTSPPAQDSSARIFSMSAVIPMLDRGVGGTTLKELRISMDMVYLGAEGGMGIYGIKLE